MMKRLFIFLVGNAALALSACSDQPGPETRVGTAGTAGVTPSAAVARAPDVSPAGSNRQAKGPHEEGDPHAALGPEPLVRVALQHQAEGRLELALQTLADAVARYPDAAQPYAVRASLRLGLQQVSAALKDLEQAVVLAPDDAGIRVNRAQAYRAFGRYEEALSDLDFALDREPDLVAARFNRGALLYAQGHFDRALVDFDHCVQVDPHAPAPYFNRASTHWELGRPEDALRDLERFVELNPNPEWKKSAEDLQANWRDALAREALPAGSGS